MIFTKRIKSYLNSKWLYFNLFRFLLHLLLLTMITIGVYYSFSLPENSYLQKLILSISSGGFLFWISPILYKIIDLRIGIITLAFISIFAGIIGFIEKINSIVKEYCIEFSVGIFLLGTLEYYFKKRNKILKQKILSESEKLLVIFKQIEDEEASNEKIKIRLELECLRKEAILDEKYAISDYFGIPRPLIELEEEIDQ